MVRACKNHLKRSPVSEAKALASRYVHFLGNHTLLQISNCAIRKVVPCSNTHLGYRPTCLIIRITSNCNQKCNFCAWKSSKIGAETFKFPDMSFKDFVNVIERFHQAISLHLSGGEPFLHKDFFKMVEYAHSRKMFVSASTNGVELDDKIDELIQSPLSVINISVDADNPNEYQKMHGSSGNTFYSVINSVRELATLRRRVESKLRIYISYVCCRDNYRKIPDIVDLAQDLGVDELEFHNLIPYDLPGFSEEQSLYEDDTEVLEIIQSVRTTRSNLRVRMPPLLTRDMSKRRCKMPFTTLTVQGDGRYYVCCNTISEKWSGNAMNERDIWNDSRFQHIREILKDGSVPLPEMCRVCPERSHPYKVFGQENFRDGTLIDDLKWIAERTSRNDIEASMKT
jgi:radical SAM protein with 4Fe4S-binding SPASM domain